MMVFALRWDTGKEGPEEQIVGDFSAQPLRFTVQSLTTCLDIFPIICLLPVFFLFFRNHELLKTQTESDLPDPIADS